MFEEPAAKTDRFDLLSKKLSSIKIKTTGRPLFNMPSRDFDLRPFIPERLSVDFQFYFSFLREIPKELTMVKQVPRSPFLLKIKIRVSKERQNSFVPFSFFEKRFDFVPMLFPNCN